MHKDNLHLLKAKEMQNSIRIAAWIDVQNLPEEMKELRNGPCHCYVGAMGALSAGTQASSHEEPPL